MLHTQTVIVALGMNRTYFNNLFSGQRKSNAYLDVPSANFNHLHVSDNDDEDVDRLRTFSSSKGGESFSVISLFHILGTRFFGEHILSTCSIAPCVRIQHVTNFCDSYK